MSLLRMCDLCKHTAPDQSAEVAHRWAVVRATEVKTSRLKREVEVCGGCLGPIIDAMSGVPSA